MSGVPYPHPAFTTASAAIGQFQIGVTPIGTPRSFDVWKTVLSQYANAPVLTQLIENLDNYLDQTVNFDNFYDFIWNVDTAKGRGLDVWGRIVNVSRILQIPTGAHFGFAEAVGDDGVDGFGQANFYSGSGLTGNYALADDAYRRLIFAKALSNITDGSMKAINQLLLNLFPNRGNTYVQEGYPAQGFFFGFAEALDCQGFGQAPFFGDAAQPAMAMTYVFRFALTPVEFAIVTQSGALPKPSGVRAFVLQLA